MIQLSHLDVIFNKGQALEKIALNRLNLDVEEGQFVTVIGSNGAGKSTVLNTLLGAVRPEQGSIMIEDNDVTAWPVWRRAALVGHVAQDPRLGSYEDLTIAENMAIARRRGGRRSLRLSITRSDRESYAESLKPLGLGLENRLDTVIGLLSGGQRQALSLLMTTARDMKVLLLDEHTSALDPRMANQVLAITEEIIAEKRLTTLMVTHSMQQALELGTRTIMMHDGRVIFDLKGPEREALTIRDLLEMFDKQGNGLAVEDRMMFG